MKLRCYLIIFCLGGAICPWDVSAEPKDNAVETACVSTRIGELSIRYKGAENSSVAAYAKNEEKKTSLEAILQEHAPNQYTFKDHEYTIEPETRDYRGIEDNGRTFSYEGTLQYLIEPADQIKEVLIALDEAKLAASVFMKQKIKCPNDYR